MDAIPVHYLVINFILKGGPPWGFRIKERGKRVVVSKINCGGRASRVGLCVNDEIVSVNNLEIDCYPFAMGSAINSENQILTAESPVQLTKLDFTYQLIKHNVNSQLHLTIRRYILDSIEDRDYVCRTPCCERGFTLPRNTRHVDEDSVSLDGEHLICLPRDLPPPESFSESVSCSESKSSSPTTSTIKLSLYDSRRTLKQLSPLLVRTLSIDSMNMSGSATTGSGVIVGERNTTGQPFTMFKFRAHAPKNIWSPGSTTTSNESENNSPDRSNINNNNNINYSTVRKVWSPESSSICSEAASQPHSLPQQHQQMLQLPQLQQQQQQRTKTTFETVTRSTQTSPEETVPSPASIQALAAGVQCSSLPRGFRPLKLQANTQTSGADSSESSGQSQEVVTKTSLKGGTTMTRPRIRARSVTSDAYVNPYSTVDLRDRDEKRKRMTMMKHHYSKSTDHDKTCVFSSLTSSSDSNDAYIMKKRECNSEPASRATYMAVQRGDMDVPLFGLQKPAPEHRAHEEFRSRSVRSSHPADQELRLARVMYNFQAMNPREISAKRDDVVILKRQIDANWFEIEDPHSGLRGLVPRNYLSAMDPGVKPLHDADEDDGLAVAKFDFDAKTPIELPLRKGDRVKIVRKVDENWYEGLLISDARNSFGIFPCTYVELLKPMNEFFPNNWST